MNETPFDDAISRFTSGWSDALLTRGIIAALGLIALVTFVRYVSGKRKSLVYAVLLLILSLACLVFAAFPQAVVGFIASTEYLMRIRIIFSILSIFVLMVTFEGIRKNHLQERYAILWVATALVVLFGTVFPAAVALLRAVTGMSYPVAMVALLFTFLVMVCFHFSIALSKMTAKHTKVSQRLALLERRAEDIEAGLKNDGKSD